MPRILVPDEGAAAARAASRGDESALVRGGPSMRPLSKLLGSALLFAAALPAFALELGQEAPEIDVTDWVKGEAIEAVASEKILVIHFFTTFDGDCKKAIPEFNKLLEAHEGKLEMVGVTTEHIDTVKEFLAENEVNYRVAVDEYDNTKAVYLKGIYKLPYAFVVNKAGKIAWQGNPTAGMDKIVGELIEGTYDLEKVLEIDKRRKALGKTMQKRPPDKAKIGAAAEKLLELEPGDSGVMGLRCQLLESEDDVDGYAKFIRKMQGLGEKSEDHGALNNLAWHLVTHGNLKWRDVEVAHAAAKKAVELSEGKESGIVDTYARVLFELGLFEEAVKEQKKAVDLAEDDDEKKNLGASLAYYEACLAMRNELGGAKKKSRR
jgi:thiol-disulfide isomerase/thioredoxin